MSARAQTANRCLMFACGHETIDMGDAIRMSQLWSVNAPYMTLLIQKAANGYSAVYIAEPSVHEMGHDDLIVSFGEGHDLDDIVRLGKKLGIGVVAPTVHCRDALELAVMAEKMGILHASPMAVDTLENKEKFTKLLRTKRFRTPQSRICRGRSEILSALRAFGGKCLIKPRDGYGSLGVVAVNMTYDSPASITEAVDWHLLRRRQAGFSGSLVQEYLGGPGWQEYGFMGMVACGELVWAMTTRKEMTPWPFFKETGHVFDPHDEIRLRHEMYYIIPEMRRLAKVLNDLEPGKHGLERAFINADILVGPRGQVVIVDASARWSGSALIQMANCALGYPAGSPHFPRAAARWAAGKSVDLAPIGQPTAAIFRKSFIEGGPIVQLAPARNAFVKGWYYMEVPRAGIVLPPLRDLGSSAEDCTVTYPVAAVEAEDGDIKVAEERWSDAIYAMGIAVLRDGVMYGPDGPMATPVGPQEVMVA